MLPILKIHPLKAQSHILLPNVGQCEGKSTQPLILWSTIFPFIHTLYMKHYHISSTLNAFLL